MGLKPPGLTSQAPPGPGHGPSADQTDTRPISPPPRWTARAPQVPTAFSDDPPGHKAASKPKVEALAWGTGTRRDETQAAHA